MAVKYEIRHAAHPEDVKNYNTERIRKEFLVSSLMVENEINLVYSEYDRFIVGGVVPTNPVVLETIDPLKANYFLERREIGIINVGGAGSIKVDGTDYALDYKEAIYIGSGNKEVIFSSKEASKPAHFYFNSATAHTSYPIKHVTLKDAIVAEMGSLETSNARRINKLIVNGVVDTCQLQMGLTELENGSVWNTMPPHVHSRRNEVYFYFSVPESQAVCHFMGQQKETRNIWVQNEEAVVSPFWSMHCGCGTSNYNFIWGMAGENLDYGDMDVIQPNELR